MYRSSINSNNLKLSSLSAVENPILKCGSKFVDAREFAQEYVIQTEVEFLMTPYRHEKEDSEGMKGDGERFVRNGKRGSSRMEKRERKSKRLARKKEGGLYKERADFSGEETSDRDGRSLGNNDSVYLLPLRGGRENEDRRKEAKRGRRSRCTSTTGA